MVLAVVTACCRSRAASATQAAGTKFAASPTTSATTGGSAGKTAAAARAAPRLSELTGEKTESLFDDFAVKFDKSYKDDDERAMRFEIFKRNLKRIDEVKHAC